MSPALATPTATDAGRLIINFHGIGAPTAAADALEQRYWCSQRVFEDVLDATTAVTQDSGVPIEITFDDGNASDLDLALPALQQRGLTATFFVCAGRIGQPGYLDGSAVHELLRAGMRIGSHGWGHVDWRRVDAATLQQETRGALDDLSSVAGCLVDEVGLPFGSYDRRVLAQLRRCAVRTVYSSDGGRALPGTWLVPRLSYSSAWTAQTLRNAALQPVSGLARARRAAQSAFKRWR